MFQAMRSWARRVKRDGLTLWFAYRNADTPWYAKALALLVVGYALSPIDLIPDFIPVLGYLDDILLLPALIWVTIRLLPENVLKSSRSGADQWLARSEDKPRSICGAVGIILIWLSAGAEGGFGSRAGETQIA